MNRTPQKVVTTKYDYANISDRNDANLSRMMSISASDSIKALATLPVLSILTIAGIS